MAQAMKIAIVDDEQDMRQSISQWLALSGYDTETFGSAEDALKTLGPDYPGIVISDIKMPGMGGMQFLKKLMGTDSALPVIMITGHGDVPMAVEAMRAGATDYLIKPVAPERLMRALRSATRVEASRNELQPLTEKMPAVLDFDAMIGTDPIFRIALARAAKAARSHGHVLIEGESGTGKEMLLRAIQATSPRAKAPFRLVNVAGVPVNSIESALFGHEKGAFAGAFESQMGALQHCDTGTLVLDEIDRLSADQQARLATTLNEGIVRPIGATHGFRIDTRLLSASNRPLSELAAKGQFDQDLLAAISATRISLPPLRERPGDIASLARHFLARIGDEPGLRHLSLADSALNLLCAYDWPGNVRQLQAVLFRAAVFCDAEMLTSSDFPQLSELIGEQAGSGHHVQEAVGVMLYTDDGNLRPLEEIEADVIRLAIGHYRGRMTEVARRLGIGRSTLYRKLSDLGIDNAA